MSLPSGTVCDIKYSHIIAVVPVLLRCYAVSLCIWFLRASHFISTDTV